LNSFEVACTVNVMFMYLASVSALSFSCRTLQRRKLYSASIKTSY